MSKKGFKKKIFVSIFSFYFIAFQFFLVPPAKAWPTFDLFGAGWEPIQKILDKIGEVGNGAVKTSVSTALSYFLQTIAKDVASGIVSGSVGQEPLFRVETFTASLKNAADNATGVFLDELSDGGFDTLGLCQPINLQSLGSFQTDISKAISGVLDDLTDSLNIIPDFGEDLTNRAPTCTFNKIIENFQDNIENVLGLYFEYLFFDVFEKNCNLDAVENFETSFSSIIPSIFGTFNFLDPFSIIPSAEKLEGAFESLLSENNNLDCKFFVKKTGEEDSNYDPTIDIDNANSTSNPNDNIDVRATVDKIISQTLTPILINSLKMTFGGYDIATASPEDLLKSQIEKSCYKMAESIDDEVLFSIADPSDYNESFYRLNGILPSSYNNSVVLYNDIVGKMDPYYYHPEVDYLEHFKKCVYVAKTGEEEPFFIEEDTENNKIEEKDCWIKIHKDDQNYIQYNTNTLMNISRSEDYKETIKKSLTANCFNLAYKKLPFSNQIAREEYNLNLKRIEEYNKKQREIAETQTVVETPNPDIEASKGQIDGNVETTSTQNVEMTKSYQNSMQDFLTPTGDVWLDAGKLFLSTLLQGYFDELKKGLFQLPENLTFNDFENFFVETGDQFDSTSDWFGDNWSEGLEDFMGVPESKIAIGEPCIMNSNCDTGLCDYVNNDKVCLECNAATNEKEKNYKCASDKVCHNNKCVDCVVDGDCVAEKGGEFCYIDNKCVECLVDSNCQINETCSSNKCVLSE